MLLKAYVCNLDADILVTQNCWFLTFFSRDSNSDLFNYIQSILRRPREKRHTLSFSWVWYLNHTFPMNLVILSYLCFYSSFCRGSEINYHVI